MISDNTIPIFFAADVDYYQHLCVLLVSILENNPGECFAFNVLTDRESDEADKIASLAETYSNFELRWIVMDDSVFEKFPLPWKHISVQMYYRLLIPALAPELDKTLYFDCDMVCNTALRELWSTPLDDCYVAGVPDNLCSKESYLKPLGLTGDGTYINSGMLSMNLRAIREDGKIAEALAWLESHPETRYPDQDAINAVFGGRIRLLDVKWNMQTGCKCKSRDGIIHFTSGKKPWKTDVYCLHHGAPLYFHYLESTPYRDYIRFYNKNCLKAQIVGRIREIVKFPERLIRNCIVKPLKKTA